MCSLLTAEHKNWDLGSLAANYQMYVTQVFLYVFYFVFGHFVLAFYLCFLPQLCPNKGEKSAQSQSYHVFS